MSSVGPILVDYFSDPLCVWSWSIQDRIERLQAEFGDRVVIRYRMLPLYRSLAVYTDLARAGAKSSVEEIAREWEETARATGVTVDVQLWSGDPPSSTWPACKAVKAAAVQSGRLAEIYLKRLRVAAMTERQNIARAIILMRLAGHVGLDREQFTRDVRARERTREIMQDIREARRNNITTRPTLLLHTADDKILISGLRSYDLFRQAVQTLLAEG